MATVLLLGPHHNATTGPEQGRFLSDAVFSAPASLFATSEVLGIRSTCGAPTPRARLTWDLVTWLSLYAWQRQVACTRWPRKKAVQHNQRPSRPLKRLITEP